MADRVNFGGESAHLAEGLLSDAYAESRLHLSRLELPYWEPVNRAAICRRAL